MSYTYKGMKFKLEFVRVILSRQCMKHCLLIWCMNIYQFTFPVKNYFISNTKVDLCCNIHQKGLSWKGDLLFLFLKSKKKKYFHNKFSSDDNYRVSPNECLPVLIDIILQILHEYWIVNNAFHHKISIILL